MANYASYSKKEAWLGTEFGEQFAIRQFGIEVVNALPRNSKGKNVGKHKAVIEWVKVEKGGWVSKGSDGDGALGHVENRVGQVIGSRLVIKQWGTDNIEVLHTKGDSSKF